LNGRNIPFVNSAKYLGVIFDRRVRVTWRMHTEMIAAKAFRTFIRLYSLFKSERLSANIKLTLHKALIRSVMTYASPAWEFAVDTHLIKLQHLQNKVLHTTGNFPSRTPLRDLHVAFKIPYSFMIMKMFIILGKVKPDTESIRVLNLAVVKHTTVQVTRLS
jgi:hypothetical protein